MEGGRGEEGAEGTGRGRNEGRRRREAREGVKRGKGKVDVSHIDCLLMVKAARGA